MVLILIGCHQVCMNKEFISCCTHFSARPVQHWGLTAQMKENKAIRLWNITGHVTEEMRRKHSQSQQRQYICKNKSDLTQQLIRSKNRMLIYKKQPSLEESIMKKSKLFVC